jgi:protein-tyrosine phosphatase
MVDIHQHLLFGIDDGSKSLAQSVAMVQMAMDDGFTHVVATPHANDQYPYDRVRNQSLLAQIRDALPADVAAAMTLGLGCDFHLNFENTEDARLHPRRYTINETEYLLIELPDIGIPARIDEILYDLRVAGMTPILTHPERNVTLQRTPAKLQEWVEKGLLLQVTAGSVLGDFGATAESMAWSLLRKNVVHFLATDAHDTQRRTPTMSAARRRVEERLGESTSDRLCVTNPKMVFEGRPLPQQPAPVEREVDPELKPGLWKRIFTR